MSGVGGSLFQGAPGPDVEAGEFVRTVQNPTEQLKIHDSLITSPL